MNSTPETKTFPAFATDGDAERFVEEADLSNYDFRAFEKTRFEFKAKTANVSMRMPEELLVALKERAAKDGLPYQRFIRQALEKALLEEGPRQK